MPKKSLFDQLLQKAEEKKRRIGITIIKTDKEILDSLKRAKKYIEVVIYGKKINRFECVELKPEDEKGTNIGRKIVQDYKEGKINQFVRGQVDDFGVVQEYKKQFNIDPAEKRVDFGLMQDGNGREFFMGVASNPEGQNLEDKIRITDVIVKWMKDDFGLEPKVAVMATCRPGSYGRDPVMSKSYDEAEGLVKHLKDQDIEAKNVHIEIENAITWANLIIPSNGTIGNQIFRAVIYLGKGKLLACPTIFPKVGMYEDDSRNEKDWFPHLIAASAWASFKR
jgi:predicted methyltransferase MtxX (methanogen marker protein 4)